MKRIELDTNTWVALVVTLFLFLALAMWYVFPPAPYAWDPGFWECHFGK